MAGRRTNLALLVLLASCLVTGGLAFGLGSGWGAWAVMAHGVLAIGIVLLSPWKSAIARRGLRRTRPHSFASIALAVVTAVTLASGLAHSTGVLISAGPVTAMQVHVTAAVVAMGLGLVHVSTRRVRWRRTDVRRRNLLRAAGLAGGSLAAYGALAGVVRVIRTPGAERRFTGSFERGSLRPDAMPITQWLDDRVPQVDVAGWRLAVGGGGETATFSLETLEGMREPVEATLDCTGGWYAMQRWEGVRLDRLLGNVGERRSILVRSVTGYARRYPFRDAARLWLATRVGGLPISPGHGAPARIVAPNRRGFWWVKWVRSVEVSDVPWWWQPPFPLT
ncbi:MAG: molybdopterin-dependent oxidoreductase [Actinobacteria bacterium]|nr:molybdopterin-dependent oxidoreductase [Actinomycetota bacterium]